MIQVIFFELDCDKPVGFKILGHSAYQNAGNDIVCAAVSSAAYMTVNTITEILNVKAKIFLNSDDGKMKIVIKPNDIGICRDILNGFRLHMKSLENDFPNNIKFFCRRCKFC
jgi:uncharacterized protein YsxB (DUF464 family)